MTLNALQALTWSTVAGAVVGAVLLASLETNFSQLSHGRRAEAAKPFTREATAQRKPVEPQPTFIGTASVRREISVR